MFDFFNYFKRLIVEVILDLLATSKKEFETLSNSPEDFVTLALDTCDKQVIIFFFFFFFILLLLLTTKIKTSETYKTGAAQLLESLCDHIDGTLTQIIYLMTTIMKYSIDCSSPNEIQQRYPLLAEFQNCKFLEKKSSEIRIETGLLILTVVSYLIPKRKDLLNTIEDFLIQYYKFFTSTQGDIFQIFIIFFRKTILIKMI